jgi:hypothetical protein
MVAFTSNPYDPAKRGTMNQDDLCLSRTASRNASLTAWINH